MSLADLLGHEFARRPGEMFSDDRFHPSAAGYAAAADALLPSVAAALGHDTAVDALADLDQAELLPVAEAAVEAVDRPGTEVSGAEVGGRTIGPRGLWAALRSRRRP